MTKRNITKRTIFPQKIIQYVDETNVGIAKGCFRLQLVWSTKEK